MGKEGNRKRTGEEGVGEGREHKLIFAIVCETDLPKCWI